MCEKFIIMVELKAVDAEAAAELVRDALREHRLKFESLARRAGDPMTEVEALGIAGRLGQAARGGVSVAAAGQEVGRG